MQLIPLSAVPSQNFQIVLANQNCAISIYQEDGYDYTDLTLSTFAVKLYFDLAYNGIDVTNGAICLNQKRLLINRQYLGFVGDFMFVDTQGTNDPAFAGLGTRYVLLYLEASDLAANG
jgi:hypothetical protein